MESTVKHSVKAVLHDNLLTDNPNDLIARVCSERTLSIPDICRSAVIRGGATTTEHAMEHNVSLFFKEMGFLLCDGYSINTGYFTAGALIKGVFSNPKESFNSDKHSVLFQFNQGTTLRKALANVKVDILGVAETGCEILQVIDVKSGTTNDLITPNRNIKIKGSKIKLAGDNPEVGLYFIHQITGETTKADASDIATNNPSELIVIVPELKAGTYSIEIRTHYNGSRNVKDLRTAIFDKGLTVILEAN